MLPARAMSPALIPEICRISSVNRVPSMNNPPINPSKEWRGRWLAPVQGDDKCGKTLHQQFQLQFNKAPQRDVAVKGGQADHNHQKRCNPLIVVQTFPLRYPAQVVANNGN